MTIRIAGYGEVGACPRCLGKGREIAGPHFAARTMNKGMPAATPGDKSWIPCRECNGRKTVLKGAK